MFTIFKTGLKAEKINTVEIEGMSEVMIDREWRMDWPLTCKILALALPEQDC